MARAEPPGAPSRPFRTALVNGAILLLSSAVAAGLAEAAFGRLNAARDAAAGDGSPQGEMARFTVYDPLLGHDGRPNVRGTLRRLAVTQNARGNRGRDAAFEKPAGVRRVVVLGDSQAWGYGVGDEETIAARLEQRLSGPEGPFEVLNLGVSGFGTDQAFLKYLVQGRRYRPDVVVLVVFKNDLQENERTSAWGVAKPRFYVKEGTLCLGNVPPPRVSGWDRDAVLGEMHRSLRVPLLGFDLRRTETVRFLESRQWRWSARAAGGVGEDVRGELGCVENRPEYAGSGSEMMVRLCVALHGKVRAVGARLLVFFTPKNKEWEEPGTAAYYDPIAEALGREGVEVLDFRALAARMERQAAPLFLPGDPHLSAFGSDLAARALADRIRRGPAGSSQGEVTTRP